MKDLRDLRDTAPRGSLPPARREERCVPWDLIGHTLSAYTTGLCTSDGLRVVLLN